MSGRRAERLQVQRRNLLARALDQAEREGLEALAPEALARSEGLPLRSLGLEPEDLFFPDEDDLRAAFAAVLDHAGLIEAVMAWARHLQEEGDLWRRRLALTEREPRLRLRRLVLDEAWRGMLAAHFAQWGAAGPAGERAADLEAELALTALRGAERRWIEGGGRPQLLVLAHEALAQLWPALYAHARRHGR